MLTAIKCVKTKVAIYPNQAIEKSLWSWLYHCEFVWWLINFYGISGKKGLQDLPHQETHCSSSWAVKN
jgi:hypothetical protein